jgi:CubicO group peptidase (beta-lactamase class C family)
MDKGVVNGKSIVPPGWFDAISRGVTDPNSDRYPGNIKLVPESGYMNQWWLIPHGGPTHTLGDDGGFVGLGAYGQQLYIVPKQRLVVVILSSDLKATASVWLPGRALTTAIEQQLRN